MSKSSSKHGDKTRRVRELLKQGRMIQDIVFLVDAPPSFVRTVKRREDAKAKRASGAYEPTAHKGSRVKAFAPRPLPSGRCLKWLIVDGKARQCGAPCEGQRCEAHKHSDRPTHGLRWHEGISV